jgi:hypothetical protein
VEPFNITELNEDCLLTAENFARWSYGERWREMDLWRRASFASSFWQERQL